MDRVQARTCGQISIRSVAHARIGVPILNRGVHEAQGHARTQYRRAIEHENLIGAEIALADGRDRPAGALDYVSAQPA
jgi:hypothetical protein